MNYLKVGKATELSGKNRNLYRFFEIIPGFLSISTLLVLLILSYFQPVWVAFFIIAFNVYWLLLVIYLAIHLLTAYNKLKKNKKIDWQKKCQEIFKEKKYSSNSLASQGFKWQDLWQLIILPTYNEDIEIIRSSLSAIATDNYPKDKKIVVLAMEERAGQLAKEKAKIIENEFSDSFGFFLITFHPDNIEGELKGKGANQTWAIKEVKEKIIDYYKIPYENILVSVFDIDTIISSGYFFVLSYHFLTIDSPYRASYQPVPVYHNNLWQAPFFSRVAASSNTFWQMMMQVREEMLVTYSSHSMSFSALVDIDFWSTKMVSEDSRIFWHCLLYYKGDYRVEPLYFPVSMDITVDKGFLKTARSLYKQQRRWAWGAENIPYLIFNTIKKWKELDKKKIIKHIFIQIYGFHSWATNALIIAIVGWMPLILGGDRFKTTVLSGNLPTITSVLMSIAMIGLLSSSIISFLLLPKRPSNFHPFKKILMLFEWIFIPVTIIIFGAIPSIDAQIRLMRGKYMGFWVTPKTRK
jgi:hypothetical protein